MHNIIMKQTIDWRININLYKIIKEKENVLAINNDFINDV